MKEFWFAIGSDLIPQLKTWRHPEELKKEVRFLIIKREGYGIEVGELPERFRVVEGVQPMGVSSSQVRRLIREEKGKGVGELVSKEVMEVLKGKGLV